MLPVDETKDITRRPSNDTLLRYEDCDQYCLWILLGNLINLSLTLHLRDEVKIRTYYFRILINNI